MRFPPLVFFIVLLALFSCSKEGDGPADGKKGSPLSVDLTVSIKEIDGKPIKNAYLIVSSVNTKNRSVRVKEGRTDLNGLMKVNANQPNTELQITVVSNGHESHSSSVRLSAEKSQMLELVLKKSESLSVLSYNVLEGFRNNEQRKTDFVNWLKDYAPDIVFFQEMNKFTEQSLSDFAKRFGHEYSVLLKTTGYPTAITSRFPITDVVRVFAGQTHGYIYAKSNGIHLFSVHLSPHSLDQRISEARAIVNHIEGIPAGEKIIVAGDLNSVNTFDEQAYTPFTEERKKYAPTVPIDFRATNSFLNAGLKDAYPLLNTVFKATIPVLNNKTDNPNQGCRYDYIYLSKNLADRCTYADILQTGFTDYASDHYPNYIRIEN